MQLAKATGPFRVVVVTAAVEEARLATPAAEPPPPQPAASMANAATATTELRISGRRQGMSAVPFSREPDG
jgi:hypothetical protein